jgi:hypothetical protein
MKDKSELERLAIEIMLLEDNVSLLELKKMAGMHTQDLRKLRNEANNSTVSFYDLRKSLKGRYTYKEICEIIARVHLFQVYNNQLYK